MISAKNFRSIKKNTCSPLHQRKGSTATSPTVWVMHEIMLIRILFHSGGYRCFKHFYQEYVCKHLAHLFPRRVSYNRFVELEQEVLFPLTIFIKTVLLGTCTGISFVDSNRYEYVETKESIYTRHLKACLHVANVQWDGSSDSNCIW